MVTCSRGHWHFAQYGGAGILIWRHNASGEVEVLLGLRSAWVTDPHKWANFGGSRNSPREAPNVAALRELEEETGIDGRVFLQRECQYTVDDHGGWAYTLFYATPRREITASDIRRNNEHDEIAWFTRTELLNGTPRLRGYGFLNAFERGTIRHLNTNLPADLNANPSLNT